MRELSGGMEIVYVLIWVVIKCVHTEVKTKTKKPHCTLYLGFVHFTVCKVYFY